jgi:hypothetical protein
MLKLEGRSNNSSNKFNIFMLFEPNTEAVHVFVIYLNKIYFNIST